ncbi:MAG: hypothetical protein LBP38_03810 [Desulfovibrio sp.]|jgi:hypothetical protein|nr:hypothetical protein [Desulfovibrio sp.]
MRTYSIDQLDEKDIAAVNARLLDLKLQAGLEGIYRLPVPERMLSRVQTDHLQECGPYCLALEVGGGSIHMELLVRGLGRITCECVAFAPEPLRNYMIKYLEEMLTDLGITF